MRRLLASIFTIITLAIAPQISTVAHAQFPGQDYFWGTSSSPFFNGTLPGSCGITWGNVFTVSNNVTAKFIAFYAAPGSTGAYTVGLWTSGGTLLTSASSSVSSGGWNGTAITATGLTSGNTYVAGAFMTAFSMYYNNTSTYPVGSHLGFMSNIASSNSNNCVGSSLTFPGTTQVGSDEYFVDVWVDPPSGTATPTPTNTPTTAPTATPTPTNTSAATATPTNTPGPTATSTNTPTPGPTSTPLAVACTNPGGSYDSTKGSQYEFIGSINEYVDCMVDIAVATQIALPTLTPTPIPTATATTTLSPTQSAVMSETGCNPRDPQSLYQDCVINDAATRNNTYTFWAIPAIFFLLLIFGVAFNAGRFHHKA